MTFSNLERVTLVAKTQNVIAHESIFFFCPVTTLTTRVLLAYALLLVVLCSVSGSYIRADTSAALIIVCCVVLSRCPRARRPVTVWHNLSNVLTVVSSQPA